MEVYGVVGHGEISSGALCRVKAVAEWFVKVCKVNVRWVNQWHGKDKYYLGG